MSARHSKGSWHVDIEGDELVSIRNGECRVVVLDRRRDGDAAYRSRTVADAKRIVACVNALADLPQDALDGGWTRAGLEAYGNRMKAERDELLAMARAFVAARVKTAGGMSTDLDALDAALRAALAAVDKAAGSTA